MAKVVQIRPGDGVLEFYGSGGTASSSQKITFQSGATGNLSVLDGSGNQIGSFNASNGEVILNGNKFVYNSGFTLLNTGNPSGLSNP